MTFGDWRSVIVRWSIAVLWPGKVFLDLGHAGLIAMSRLPDHMAFWLGSVFLWLGNVFDKWHMRRSR